MFPFGEGLPGELEAKGQFQFGFKKIANSANISKCTKLKRL